MTNGSDKARVSYGVDSLLGLGRKCVAIYAKDWDESLVRILSTIPAQRQAIDPMDDNPGDRAVVVLFEDHPLYQAARLCAEKQAHQQYVSSFGE